LLGSKFIKAYFFDYNWEGLDAQFPWSLEESGEMVKQVKSAEKSYGNGEL
jgi:sialic acid synthase SpsE